MPYRFDLGERYRCTLVSVILLCFKERNLGVLSYLDVLSYIVDVAWFLTIMAMWHTGVWELEAK
jgi:hypothetical protein